MFTFAYDCFNSTCSSPSMKAAGLMLVEKMSPRLQTICTSLNWCLSLALVCFWGLRRVKYAWLQHGWLWVFFPNQQTNDMKSLFCGDKQNSELIFFRERTPREFQQLTRFVCFSWNGGTVIFTESTGTCWTGVWPRTRTYAHAYAPNFSWLRRRQT